MGKGWHQVTRLGGTGARYPHILVDPHGWCLRWGPNSRSDDKFYSSLPMLLSGLVEQGARRRLMPLSAALEIKELRREVKDALYSALSLCHEVLERGGLEEHIRRLEARRVTSVASDPGGAALVARSGGQATSGQAQRRQAV